MTKSTGIPRHILKVIFLMVLNLQKCFSLAEADAHFLPGSQIISTFPHSHSSNFGKDLADPLATSGTEFRTLTSVRGQDGSIFQGTTTYGRTGRWVGRAYPVFKRPSSSVVSASMIVRGGVTNPNVYNPYGINQRRPSSRPAPPFLPPNNVYIPYGTPQYFTRYNPYFNRPVIQDFEYIPVGHVRRFNRPANNHVLYREVDPSYLIFGNDIGSRAFFLETNPTSSTIAKRKAKKEDFFSLSDTETLENNTGNSSEVLLSSEDSVSPAKQLFTFFSQNDSQPIYTEIDPEAPISSLEANAKQSLNTTDFIPITFIATTPKPKGSATFTFGSFNPKPSENPSTSFEPINFIPSTPKPINTFSFDPLTTTRSPKRQGPNSIPDEIDLEDIDRTISDIIRIIPARRRGNTTRNNRRHQSTRPPRHPDLNPEGFPGLHPPRAPPGFPEQLPPDRPEVDDEGWTIIKPRFKGTIRRTFVDEPPGRIPEHVTDVEFFTDTPEIRKTRKPVIDKSFDFGSAEEKQRKDMSREELITPGPLDKPMTSGKALSAETMDEGSSTTSIREHVEVKSDSSVRASFSATTVTSVMATGVLLIQWLSL